MQYLLLSRILGARDIFCHTLGRCGFLPGVFAFLQDALLCKNICRRDLCLSVPARIFGRFRFVWIECRDRDCLCLCRFWSDLRRMLSPPIRAC